MAGLLVVRRRFGAPIWPRAVERAASVPAIRGAPSAARWREPTL